MSSCHIMGLFDTFEIPGTCLDCGQTIETWQSKQLDRMMDVYHIGDKIPEPEKMHLEIKKYSEIPVYKSCEKCGKWNDALLIVVEKIITGLKVIPSKQ